MTPRETTNKRYVSDRAQYCISAGLRLVPFIVPEDPLPEIMHTIFIDVNNKADHGISSMIFLKIYIRLKGNTVMKFIKRIAAAAVCIVLSVLFSSCSGDYVMTEEDLAIQKSLVGYWAAGNKTGYNTYDENGTIKTLFTVEFTEDFNYIIYECHIDEGFFVSYDPIKYTFEDGKFRVDVDGVPSYAGVTVSEDGNTMYWITDQKTDQYERMSESGAIALGISGDQSANDTQSGTDSTASEENAVGNDAEDAEE